MNKRDKNETAAGRMRTRTKAVLSAATAIAAITLTVLLTVLIMPKADLNGTVSVSGSDDDDAAALISAAATYTVTGNVSHGEAGLSGAYVGYYIGEAYTIQYAVTDSDGNYTISDVPVRTYVDIQPPLKNGFLTDGPEIRATAGNAIINFTMYPDGITSFSITGKTTFCGNGLDGVEIRYTIDGNELTAYSDHGGRYSIEAPAGSTLSIIAAKEEYVITSPMNFYMGGDMNADIRMYHPEEWVMVIIDPNNRVDEYYVIFVEKGKTAERPEDPKMHSFVISGWYTFGSEWDFDTPISDVTIIFAEYTYDTENWFLVTFDPNNFKEPWIWYVNKDDPYLEIQWEPKLDSFVFEGWYLDGSEWNAADPVTADITLTAKFDCDKNDWFFVTFDPNNGWEDPRVAAVSKNDPYAVKPKDPWTSDGLEFDAWYLNGEEWDFGTPVTENITLTAQHVRDMTLSWCIVTFDPDNGESATEVWVQYWRAVDPADAPKRPGYAFTGWYVEDGWEWDFNMPVRKDMTFTAGYAYDPGSWALVTFDPDNGSAATEMPIHKGTAIPMPEDPEKHAFIFAWWNVNGKEWDFDDPVFKDITLTAKYSHDPEHWAFVIFERDNGQPAGRAWYEPGSLLQRPDDPKKYTFLFDAWHCGGSEWDFGTPVKKNTVLAAQYSYDPEFWTFIIVTSNEGGSFEYRPDGEGPFLPLEGAPAVLIGTLIEVTAIPDDGYVFIWDDGTISCVREFIAGIEHPKGMFALPAVQMTDASEVPAGTGGGPGPEHAALLLSLLALALIVSVLMLRERERQ